MVPVTTWQAMFLNKMLQLHTMSVHSCVRRSSWRTPNSGRFTKARTVTGDIEEHRKQCQLQLYLIRGIVPCHTVGNISSRRHFGAFHLHNGTRLDIYSSTPDVFLYQGAPSVEPIVAFPGRTLLALLRRWTPKADYACNYLRRDEKSL